MRSATQAFAKDAANFTLCVCPAFSYFTTQGATAIANNFAAPRLPCGKTKATG